ncbi:MAG: hypothetical protein R3F30_02950 [Planctomycetota bacterium]
MDIAAGKDVEAGKSGGEPQRQDWRIADKGLCCARCGQGFTIGEELYSVLELRPAAEADDGPRLPLLVRRDHCQACFKAARGELERQHGGTPPIFWRTRRREPDRREPRIDLDGLAGLFTSLLEQDRPEVEALRYVVGLMLVRKKRLRQVRVAGARGDLVFRDPRDPEGQRIVRLPAPELDEATVETLKEELGRLLG